MGRSATRSVFAAALCTGVAMVGASVHGLLGVDAELQRSALAADQQRTFQHVEYRTFEPEPRHVFYKRDCAPQRSPHHLS
jgi:hypothetical protein